jgi:phosphatidylinositol alpha-mannosyltransferase
MKIALVCPYNMIDNSGGVAQVVLHLREALQKKSHSVKIITPKPANFEGLPPQDFILLGTLTGINFGAGLGTGGTWTFDVDSQEVKRVLEREKFDVINFHEPWAPILARQILPYSTSANVGTFHANLIDSAAAKSLSNLFVPYARGVGDKLDLITAVSPAPAALLIGKDPDHRLVKNIKYIPNGIDIKKYQTRPVMAVKHPKQKTILFVGRLEGRKGVKYLLRSFNELSKRHKDVQLLIAGKGPDDKKLRAYVEELNIPRVTFLGYVSDEDKIHHLHRADVFCSPAMRGESFGIVLLEAMAAACPIVAGDNIGYQSVMKGLGALSLVNPQDAIDFARRLELFLYEEDLRKVWLKWAQTYVKQYDYARVVDLYEDAYREAIKVHEKLHAQVS